MVIRVINQGNGEATFATAVSAERDWDVGSINLCMYILMYFMQVYFYSCIFMHPVILKYG